jgi:hypothetical protein
MILRNSPIGMTADTIYAAYAELAADSKPPSLIPGVPTSLITRAEDLRSATPRNKTTILSAGQAWMREPLCGSRTARDPDVDYLSSSLSKSATTISTDEDRAIPGARCPTRCGHAVGETPGDPDPPSE